MRVLRVARVSARKGRTQALNQMRGLISTAPEPIRAELRGLNVFHLLERASTYRPGAKRDIVSLTKLSLRMLARRAITLEEEVSEIDAILKPLVRNTARVLVGALGVGHRRRLGTVGHRRRQPRALARRSRLRPSLRCLTDRSQQRQAGTVPAQSRR